MNRLTALFSGGRGINQNRRFTADEVEIQERQGDFINEIRKLAASGTTITPTMVEKLLEEFKIPPADN
ncbi:unnamed protein product [Rotaria socialis]|uniref:Uncharacterized protein n=2 Tax=Rotaria socialis TaxID=392032 RepID=A0A818B4Q5_9BILA|nr:unnamed protein product [Rotaria socialis]